MFENKIKKRDGRIVDYDFSKISNAIEKASKASNQSFIGEDFIIILHNIKNEVESLKGIPSVYDIEKIVENHLMDSNYKEIAREYIGYRRHREIVRNENSDMYNKVRGLLDNTDQDIVSENANKDSKVLPVQRDLLSGIISREYGVEYMMPKDVAEYHKNGDIHFHDTDYSPLFKEFNCMLIDFRTMFEKGFKLGNAPLSYPKSIGVACAVTAQIVAQISSSIYGGNSFNRIDEVLDRFVTMSFAKNYIEGFKYIAGEKLDYYTNERNQYFIKENSQEIKYDNDFIRYLNPKVFEYATDITEKDTYDAFQGLEYEINSIYSANGQTPFHSIGFGLGTTWESRLIQKSILKVRIKGLGEEEDTAIFPKLIFVIKSGINKNPEDPNYDIKQLALECSSKRMYPDIVSYDKIVEFTGNFKFPIKIMVGLYSNI